MPGHKLGKGIPCEPAQNLLQLDVTEVAGTDNLHFPEGIIKEAQEQAAKAFGADSTFFLVNGSTCGVQAAIMSVCARGQKVIVGRDSHKSVASGIILSGAEPVFVYPKFYEEFSVSAEISPESIEDALRANPDAVAVLITRPNYYGICSDIERISSLVHSCGKILIVDEAHGAHFAFSDRLPETALEHGADICIQSAHKTLPAVTQGAYLHVKGSRINMDRLRFNLSMLQTSSPSYIIMSYLDIARELMEQEGRQKLETLADIIARFNKEIEKTGVYKVLSSDKPGIKFIQDTSRLVINIEGLGISGYHAEKILREKFNTQVEMADFSNLVFIVTVADDCESIARLLDALKGLETMNLTNIQDFRDSKLGELKEILKKSCNGQFKQIFNGTSKQALAQCGNENSHSRELQPWEAYYADKEFIDLMHSSGRICCEIITPYPPGIPLFYPGEIISESGIQYINEIISAGGKVNGIGDNKSISVIKNFK